MLPGERQTGLEPGASVSKLVNAIKCTNTSTNNKASFDMFKGKTLNCDNKSINISFETLS